MQVQYIYDENGIKTGVIVPITLWQDLSPKKRPLKKKVSFEPSKFRGIYRNLALNFEDELQDLRKEWERV